MKSCDGELDLCPHTGHYCPEGTITDDQFPCLPGTFTGLTNLTSADECEACPQGMYCDWGTGMLSFVMLPLGQVSYHWDIATVTLPLGQVCYHWGITPGILPLGWVCYYWKVPTGMGMLLHGRVCCHWHVTTGMGVTQVTCYRCDGYVTTGTGMLPLTLPPG